MPDTEFDVFLSHTSEMGEYPQDRSFVDAALDAIRQSGLVGRDMRDFPAADQSPSETDLQEVQKCRIYVGLLGFCFGDPVRDQAEISYTWQEFRKARELGIPTLVFLLHEDQTLLSTRETRDLDHGPDQERFRQEVLNLDGKGLTCQFFKTPDELQRLLKDALLHLNDNPGEPAPDRTAHYKTVLQTIAAQRVQEWESAREAEREQQDRLEHYVAPHYSLLMTEDELAAQANQATEQHQVAAQQLLFAEGKAERTSWKPLAHEEDAPDAELARLLTCSERLCIAEDAGAGKSVFTRRVLAYASSAAGQQELFQGQPGLVVRFEQWERDWPADIPAALVREVTWECERHDPAVDPQQLIDWALRNGRVLLLLDGLDQVQRPEAVTAVSEFLSSGGESCRVILTGRPYSVDQRRRNLLRSDRWRFGRIEGFDDEQIADYLAGFDVDQVFPDRDQVRDLICIPSVLRMVRELLETGSGIAAFQTRGELYRQACSRMIDEAGPKVDADFDDIQAQRVEQILAAIAFAMMTQECYEYAVRGRDAVNRIEAASASCCAGGITPDEKRTIRGITRFTNHCLLEGTSEQMLSWQHRGIMEYYCGLHLARYATDVCRRQAAAFAAEEQWYWAWRFAIEFPASILADPEQRAASIACLFGPAEHHRRPAELMYRSWDVLQETSTGVAALQRFLDEYPRLLPDTPPLQSLENGFLPCPPEATSEQTSFLMGSPDDEVDSWGDEKPQTEVFITGFLMAASPVTMSQFAAFDPAYLQAEQADLETRAPEAECPAINITWYDAWCFARWSGSRLPSEPEWEFACRAGTTTAYWWGPKMDQSKCTFDSEPTTPAQAEHANPWGLMEMSGNVFEWCEDWYDSDLSKSIQQQFVGTSRVSRGGAFSDANPVYLRSAYRGDYFSPDSRSGHLGFRISRTK